MKISTPSAQSGKFLVAARNRATLEAAHAAGFLGGSKSARVAGRVSATLIAAAKRSAGVSSDTEVIEVALARLALEDDFGAKLARKKGTVSKELDIEF
jgi:Arc/MetJ family transcription regulator